MEQWKSIPGVAYEISDRGNVRRAMDTVPQGNTWPGKPRKLRLSRDYPTVTLQGKSFYVHVLVANAFLGPCPLGKELNHKDFDQQNYRLENLHYVTHKENVALSAKADRMAYGSRHPLAKCTEILVKKLREEYIPWKMTYSALGKKYGLKTSTVHSIVNKINWKQVA